MHAILLTQISNVKQYALLIVENHFAALKAKHLFLLVLDATLRCLVRVLDAIGLFFLLNNLEKLTNEGF